MHRLISSLGTASVAGLLAVASADAVILAEVEPNDDIGSAQALGAVGPGGITVQGFREETAGGPFGALNELNDYFSFTAPSSGLLVIETANLVSATFGADDSFITLFGAGGDEIVSDDNSGTALASRIEYFVGAPGSFFLGLGGFFGDDTFSYDLNVSLESVSAPAALSLFGLGVLGFAAARRSRS